LAYRFIFEGAEKIDQAGHSLESGAGFHWQFISMDEVAPDVIEDIGPGIVKRPGIEQPQAFQGIKGGEDAVIGTIVVLHLLQVSCRLLISNGSIQPFED